MKEVGEQNSRLQKVLGVQEKKKNKQEGEMTDSKKEK